MNLIAAELLVEKLMFEHGLTSKGWTFEFNDRKRSFGVCDYNFKTIALSKSFTSLNSVEEVRETILHEIAHALVPPRHGHDAVWQAKCVEIGCKPETRCGEEVAAPQPRYVATCEDCGMIDMRHRRPMQHLMCMCQDGKLDEDIISLKYVDTKKVQPATIRIKIF